VIYFQNVMIKIVVILMINFFFTSFPDPSRSNLLYHKFIESIVNHLKWEALNKYIVWLKNIFVQGYMFDSAEETIDLVRK